MRESREEARLEEYLRQRLIEIGWKDELKNHCKELIRRKGLEKVTIGVGVHNLTDNYPEQVHARLNAQGVRYPTTNTFG